MLPPKSSTMTNYDQGTLPAEINSKSGSVVDTQFLYTTAHGSAIAEVAQANPVQTCMHNPDSSRILQGGEPIRKWTRFASVIKEKLYLPGHSLMVAYTLPVSKAHRGPFTNYAVACAIFGLRTSMSSCTAAALFASAAFSSALSLIS